MTERALSGWKAAQNAAAKDSREIGFAPLSASETNRINYHMTIGFLQEDLIRSIPAPSFSITTQGKSPILNETGKPRPYLQRIHYIQVFISGFIALRPFDYSRHARISRPGESRPHPHHFLRDLSLIVRNYRLH